MRRRTDWLLPYAVIAWTTVTTLWRPGITPDHPWASRRLIVVVIPGMLLFALWTIAWAIRRVRRLGVRAPGRGLRRGDRRAPDHRARRRHLGRDGVHAHRAGRGRPGEGAVPPGRAEGLGPARRARDRRPVRPAHPGTCGVPTGRATVHAGASVAREADVRRITKKIVAAGRRPVVLGADASDVAPYGTPRRVFHVFTRRDSGNLTSAPQGTWSLTINVWMAEPMYTG